MERNAYLQLCKEASLLPYGLNYIRENVPEALTVTYKGIKYYPYTFYFLFKNGIPEDRAVLHDLKANSHLCVPLSEVKGAEE